ncbi:MAG: hypothetical protein PUD80_07745 [Firmicutes bacterium]|nr:hypothetical protein [Bacillota bacterium]
MILLQQHMRGGEKCTQKNCPLEKRAAGVLQIVLTGFEVQIRFVPVKFKKLLAFHGSFLPAMGSQARSMPQGRRTVDRPLILMGLRAVKPQQHFAVFFPSLGKALLKGILLHKSYLLNLRA